MIRSFLTNPTSFAQSPQADTCGTICLAAKHLENAGATSVIALVTHGILSGPALENVNGSSIAKLVVTNTIPQHDHLEACSRLVCVDISQVLAETIRRSHYGLASFLIFSILTWTRWPFWLWFVALNVDDGPVNRFPTYSMLSPGQVVPRSITPLSLAIAVKRVVVVPRRLDPSLKKWLHHLPISHECILSGC